MLDFQGAGLAGGDVIRFPATSTLSSVSININLHLGAALPGAGDGVTQLGYTQRDAIPILIADTNDDGCLTATTSSSSSGEL